VVTENDFVLKIYAVGYWYKGNGSYRPEEVYRVRAEVSNDVFNGSQRVSTLLRKWTGGCSVLIFCRVIEYDTK
jgi:hypothetical protein